MTHRQPKKPCSPKPNERKALIRELREFARAYPEEIFTPFTDAEREQYAAVITRASGAMGRHLAPWLLSAAKALDQIDADAGLMERARALLDEADERMRKCFHCNQAELHSEDCEVRLVIDALRTRLGQENDDE